MSAFTTAPARIHDGESRGERLQAFHPELRGRVRRVARGPGPLEDLADSFPALLFALATGFGTPEARTRARRLVEEGAPLRQAAHVLALPWWLRRLPAEAFLEPLRDVPDGPDFAQRIIAHVPKSGVEAKAWLWAVLYAHHACHAPYALWVASWIGKSHRYLIAPYGDETFRLMTAWAWHAGRPGTPGHRLLRRPWSDTLGVRRALDELVVWRRRTALSHHLSANPGDCWVREGHAMGYDFVALRTAEEFVREAAAMDNCLDQFADRLEQGASRVFSVRKNGRSLADLEIGAHDEEPAMPTVRQLKGPRNRRARPELWQAAYAWLGAQALRPHPPCPERASPARALAARLAFWKPYLESLDDPAIERAFRQMVVKDGLDGRRLEPESVNLVRRHRRGRAAPSLLRARASARA
jgi:hypothetical protein